MTKYIFFTGGVLSSVGKGVSTASVGRILQARGFQVRALKIDPYVNVDAGTMNPFAHGEVYVTEDGGETDLDLGWYERFLDFDIAKDNYITTGQIYGGVIEKERRGDYLGRCVQIVPHVTDEIKRRIRSVAEATRPDLLLVEVGGTTGDIESLPFLEAVRQLRLEEGFFNVLFIHIALVPILDVTGEQKTKPLQHSVNELRRIGIQPDLVVARCDVMIEGDVKRKIALFTSVEEKGVFCSPTSRSVYGLPLVFDDQGMGEYICQRLHLPTRPPEWGGWVELVKGFVEPKVEVRVAMCGKYSKLADSYVSINEALKHAAAAEGARAKIDWIETESFEEDPARVEGLGGYDGVLIPPGFGARGTEGKIMAIRYAREHNIPFLGVCFGFQMAVVEFARNVCGLEGANSTENQPSNPNPVIDLLPEQRREQNMGGSMRLGGHEIVLKPQTQAHRLYGVDSMAERHRHRYEVNPNYWEALERGGLVFSGRSQDGRRMEILELPKNRFHLGTQFHPEFKSRPARPSPPYHGFIKAALEERLRRGRGAMPVELQAVDDVPRE